MRHLFFAIFLFAVIVFITGIALFVVRALANVGGVFFPVTGPGLTAGVAIAALAAAWAHAAWERD